MEVAGFPDLDLVKGICDRHIPFMLTLACPELQEQKEHVLHFGNRNHALSSLPPLVYFIFKLLRLYVQRDRHLHATLSSGKEQDSDTSPDVTNPTAF